MMSLAARCYAVVVFACFALTLPAARAIAGDTEAQDSCATAEVITCVPPTTQLMRNTRNATSDANDPVPSCQPNVGHSVWFKFTAACNGSAAFDTVGSDYDTVLAVYTGTCGLWTEVACHDDIDYAGGNAASSVNFGTTAGTMYFVAVFGFGTNSGSLELNFICLGAPSITCPADITAECTGTDSCVGACLGPVTGAHVSYTTPTDSCDPNNMVTCSPASGSFFPLGMTTVTCTSRDDAGAEATCTFKVTVQDTTPPMITCPTVPPAECTSPSGAVVMYTTPTATDTCDPDPNEVCSPPSGSTFPIGSTTVTCTATDASGNVGTCTFPVVVRDTVPPMIMCPANITAECTSPSGAAVTFMATATDVCDASPTIVCAPSSGSTFPFGTTSVMCTATDDSMNSATCAFSVTVVDTVAPSITCPSTQTRECTGPTGAIVNYPSPSVSDVCDLTPTVICNPPSGSLFPLGSTTVTCTATDDHQNTGTCTFMVNVLDRVAPLIRCPNDIEKVCSGDPEGTEVDFHMTATDLCDPTPLVICNPPSDSHFPLGQSQVRCTATDDAGNVARCQFQVRILGSTSSALATTVVGQPASALIFPLFDSTRGRGTIITVTNTNTDRHTCGNGFRHGDVKLLYTYFGFDPGREFCREFNTEHHLTPGDTLTVLADQDNPEGVLGWLWVEARDPETGAAIEFDHLIGSAIIVDTGLDFMDQYLAYGFRSYASEAERLSESEDACGRAFTDVNGNGRADFDGVEYDFWPQRLLLDEFFQQGDGTQGFANELTLASCDIDPFDNSRTIVSAHPWNNRERRFSATFDFECFFHAPLAPAISNVFRGLGGDPNELVFAGHHLQTGWLELDATDPILGVFFQRVVGTGFAAGHQLQFAGQFGGPCDDNRNHEPCSLPRVD